MALESQAEGGRLKGKEARPVISGRFYALTTVFGEDCLMIKMLRTILILFSAGLAYVQQSAPAQSQTCIPDPQLEVYHHTLNENGTAQYVVIYHADHTFQFNAESPRVFSSLSTVREKRMYLDESAGRNYGTWENGCTKFCWVEALGRYAGRKNCKRNGHYIGRTPIPGWAPPSTSRP
jgi:hypothetical protein